MNVACRGTLEVHVVQLDNGAEYLSAPSRDRLASLAAAAAAIHLTHLIQKFRAAALAPVEFAAATAFQVRSAPPAFEVSQKDLQAVRKIRHAASASWEADVSGGTDHDAFNDSNLLYPSGGLEDLRNRRPTQEHPERHVERDGQGQRNGRFVSSSDGEHVCHDGDVGLSLLRGED